MPFYRLDSSNYSHDTTSDIQPNKMFYDEQGNIFYMKEDGTVIPANAASSAHEVTTVQGPAGRDGAQGPAGPKGDTGPAGADGKDGLPGRDGVDGKDGVDGTNGVDGADGAQGPQGIQGLKGDKGDTGTQGIQGIQGLKGDTGATGAQGVAGPAGVGIKGFASGYVNAGQFVTLDNLKFSVTTAGNRGLSCATVSGTAVLSISSSYSVVGGASGSSTQYPGGTYTTTPSGSWFGYHFPNAGDGSVYLANDYTNGRVYRITLLIGVAYNNNFISIERLA